MKKVTAFETVYEHAAGIDIGAEKIFVSPDGLRLLALIHSLAVITSA